jgi:hypothetical protein
VSERRRGGRRDERAEKNKDSQRVAVPGAASYTIRPPTVVITDLIRLISCGKTCSYGRVDAARPAFLRTTVPPLSGRGRPRRRRCVRRRSSSPA